MFTTNIQLATNYSHVRRFRGRRILTTATPARRRRRLVPGLSTPAHPPRGRVPALNDLAGAVPAAAQAAGDAVPAQKGGASCSPAVRVARQLLGGELADGQHAVAREAAEALAVPPEVVRRVLLGPQHQPDLALLGRHLRVHAPPQRPAQAAEHQQGLVRQVPRYPPEDLGREGVERAVVSGWERVGVFLLGVDQCLDLDSIVVELVLWCFPGWACMLRDTPGTLGAVCPVATGYSNRHY